MEQMSVMGFYFVIYYFNFGISLHLFAVAVASANNIHLSTDR